MARNSVIQREFKKEKLVAKYADRRAKLKAIVKDLSATEDERFEAQQALQKLPRSSSVTRLRSRCEITGRPRGVYRKFKLCRNKLRKFAMNGKVPGLKKASW